MRVYCSPCRTHWSIQLDSGDVGRPRSICCPRCRQPISTSEDLLNAAYLEILNPGEGQTTDRYPIIEPLMIGRDPGNHIQLLSGKVSRHHARVFPENQRYFIEDLSSLNGTHLAGVKLHSRQALNHLDEIIVGEYFLRFHGPESAQPTLAGIRPPNGDDQPDVQGHVLEDDLAPPQGSPKPPPTAPENKEMVRLDRTPIEAESSSPFLLPTTDPMADEFSADRELESVEKRVAVSEARPSFPIQAPGSTPERVCETTGPREFNGNSQGHPAEAPTANLEGKDQGPVCVVAIPADLRSRTHPRSESDQSREVLEIERENERLRTMIRTQEELRELEGVGAIHNRGLDLALDMIPARRGVLFTNDQDELTLSLIRFRDSGVDRRNSPLPRTLLDRARQRKESLLSGSGTPVTRAGSVDKEPAGSMITVPLVSGDSCLAILHLDNNDATIATFSRDDLDRLTCLGTQIAIAIARARLSERRDEDLKIKRSLSRHLNPSLIETILKNSPHIERPMTRQDATVLFTDILGFTEISEGLSPTDIAKMLNEYFELMVDIVFKHHGTLDKYLGSGLMAAWGVPVQTQEDTFHAIRAALEMQAEIEHLNARRRRRGEEVLQVGIGLNTGPVLAGHFGSSRRLEFTCMGQPVDLASRVCGMAQQGQIIITRATLEKLRDRARVIPLKNRKLEGDSTCVLLYEVLGLLDLPGDAPPLRGAPRLKVAFSVMWSRDGSQESLEGIINDISRTGCALQVQHSLEQAFKYNDLLSLGFCTPGGDPIEGLVGRIVAVQYRCNAHSDVYYDLKIQFVEISPMQEVVLDKMTAESSVEA